MPFFMAPSLVFRCLEPPDCRAWGRKAARRAGKGAERRGPTPRRPACRRLRKAADRGVRPPAADVGRGRADEVVEGLSGTGVGRVREAVLRGGTGEAAAVHGGRGGTGHLVLRGAGLGWPADLPRRVRAEGRG